MLKIKNLKLKKDNKEILKGIDLEIKKGEVQALLGPNASGKSTFVQVIAGNPKFKSAKGEIFFNGKEISKLSPEKRVKLGLVLSWQNPPAIKGVKFSNLLKKISKSAPLSMSLRGGTTKPARSCYSVAGGQSRYLIKRFGLSQRGFIAMTYR